MWHKVRELQLKGLNKTQIGIYLGVNRKTVRRYLNMTMEEFVKKQSSHRKYRLKLENYEQYVRANLDELRKKYRQTTCFERCIYGRVGKTDK